MSPNNWTAGSLTVHDLLVLRRHLNTLEYDARKHFASFPKVLAQDVKRVNYGLNQAILLLKKADDAEIRRVRIFAAKPPEEDTTFGFRWPVTHIQPVITQPLRYAPTPRAGDDASFTTARTSAGRTAT